MPRPGSHATVVGAVANGKVSDGTTTATLLDNRRTTPGRSAGRGTTRPSSTPRRPVRRSRCRDRQAVTTIGSTPERRGRRNYLLQQPNYLPAATSPAALAETWPRDARHVGSNCRPVRAPTPGGLSSWATTSVSTPHRFVGFSRTRTSTPGSGSRSPACFARTTPTQGGQQHRLEPDQRLIGGDHARLGHPARRWPTPRPGDATTALDPEQRQATTWSAWPFRTISMSTGNAAPALLGFANATGNHLVDPTGYLLTGVDAGANISRRCRPTGVLGEDQSPRPWRPRSSARRPRPSTRPRARP